MPMFALIVKNPANDDNFIFLRDFAGRYLGLWNLEFKLNFEKFQGTVNICGW